MIDADYAAINYVSGSHQLDRVLHKVVTLHLHGVSAH